LAAFVRRRVFNDELKMTDSQRLLADYVETGSETAFRELVLSYINLVYSAAVRLVDGDTHLAEEDWQQHWPVKLSPRRQLEWRSAFPALRSPVLRPAPERL